MDDNERRELISLLKWILLTFVLMLLNEALQWFVIIWDEVKSWMLWH